MHLLLGYDPYLLTAPGICCRRMRVQALQDGSKVEPEFQQVVYKPFQQGFSWSPLKVP